MNTRTVILAALLVLALTVIGGLFYLWGYPQSGDKRFRFKRGSLEYVIRVYRSDPLPFPYSSTLYVGNTKSGYSAYYLEHEDFYWWSAEIREEADSVITIIKNGSPIVELDLETSETKHYRNGSKRSAMDKIEKLHWQ